MIRTVSREVLQGRLVDQTEIEDAIDARQVAAMVEVKVKLDEQMPDDDFEHSVTQLVESGYIDLEQIGIDREGLEKLLILRRWDR